MSSSQSQDSARRRRPGLSAARIIEAAVTIADAEGLEAVSMRRVASELGAKAMSLYNHLAGRDAIVDGMVDAVIAEVYVPDVHGEWRSEMRRRARSAHKMLVRHSWAALAILPRINVGPAMLRYIDATLGCLMEAGLSPAAADHAWNAMDNHIYGFTLQELTFPVDAPDYAAVAGDYIDHIPAETYPYMSLLSRMVAEGSHSGVNDFEFGLDLILDGLADLIEQTEDEA
jgi:AcrR family transcriptional regulator